MEDVGNLERLRDSDYRSLFEAVDQGMVVCELVRDREGRPVDVRYLDANDALEEQTGLRRDEVVGRLVTEILPDAWRPWLDLAVRTVESGRPVRLDVDIPALDRIFDLHVHPLAGDRFVSLYQDVTSQRRSDAEHAFLLELSDALREPSDEEAIGTLGTRLVGERLQVDRCWVARIWRDENRAVVGPEHLRADLAPMAGEYRLSDFPSTNVRIETEPFVVPDLAADPGLTELDRASLGALGVAALLIVPLRRGERNFVWALGVACVLPRAWTREEVRLLEEVAERTWAAVERARADAAMRQSEEKYRSLFDTMGQGYAQAEMVRDDDGKAVDYRLLEANPAFERLIGIPVADALGRRVRDFVPGIEDWWIEWFDRVVSSGVAERMEHELAPLGRWYQVDAYAAGGDRFVVLYDDVTARKRAELALRESEELQAFLLDLSDTLRPLDDPVEIQYAAARELGRHLAVDRAVYFGVESEPDGDGYVHVVERDFFARPEMSSIVGRHPQAAYVRSVFTGLETGETAVLDDAHAIPGMNDAERSAYARVGIRSFVAVPLVKGGRYVAGFAAMAAAPRHWTQAEIAVVEETAERTWAAVERSSAEAAARVGRELRESREREFVANAAHDLRTPVAGIVSAVEALEAGAKELPAERDRFLAHVRRESDRLTRLSDSLLLLTRIESSSEVPRSPVDVGALLASVAAGLELQPGVRVAIDSPDASSVTTNGGLLERIVANLAENAAKHTAAGHIELRATPAGGGLAVEVRDTGSGISPEIAERGFDRFYRGGDRTGEGFGLGLTIASRAATALGGELTLESAPGGGTIARLLLPQDAV